MIFGWYVVDWGFEDLDSSDARPDLCLGIAGCWGSLYWLLRGVCCLVVRECFCWSWGIRGESLKKG